MILKHINPTDIEAFYHKVVCTPIKNLMICSLWKQNEKYSFILKSDRFYLRAIQKLNNIFSSMTYNQFLQYYAGKTPIFNAYTGDINVYYYNINTCVNILDMLLKYQFDNNIDHIKDFLQKLHNILEKKVPKINCIEVVSPSSAGKNYFFDCVIRFYINSGNIGNFNRHCNFPFQDAIDRRVNMWNEPNCETGAYDTIKMLFGGDDLPARVKFEGEAIIPKTYNSTIE